MPPVEAIHDAQSIVLCQLVPSIGQKQKQKSKPAKLDGMHWCVDGKQHKAEDMAMKIGRVQW